jgi:hypothetical protein
MSLWLAVARHNIPSDGHELQGKPRPPEHHGQKRAVGDWWSGKANCGDTVDFLEAGSELQREHHFTRVYSRRVPGRHMLPSSSDNTLSLCSAGCEQEPSARR